MAVSSKVGNSLPLAGRLWNALSAWTIRNSGYQKIGLRREDLYNEDDPAVQEAIRRLPEKEKDLRLFRMKRALDLDLKRSVLPRELWTTPEEDVSYLRPYLQQVEAEMEERKLWNKKQ